MLVNPIYGTRENQRYLKQHGIRFAGKLLGRPKKVTEANLEELKQFKAQQREEYLQRIPIEGKFGQHTIIDKFRCSNLPSRLYLFHLVKHHSLQ